MFFASASATTRLVQNSIFIKYDNQEKNTWYMELQGSPALNRYTKLEFHTVFYPYNREIDASNLQFRPFQDYIVDILDGQKSLYYQSKSGFDKFFGLILGLGLAGIFYLIKTDDLISIQSITSVIGFYFVGKELWKEIDNFLINITSGWLLRYVPKEYAYSRENHSTLNDYLVLARRKRFGIPFPLPDKLDIIKQSSGQSIKLFYQLSGFPSLKQDQLARVLNMEVNPDLHKVLDKNDYLLACKYVLTKTFFGINFNQEFFQSRDKKQIGCIGEDGKWYAQSIFVRKTISIGRVKLYLSSRRTDGAIIGN
jgi:hypothetical protein